MFSKNFNKFSRTQSGSDQCYSLKDQKEVHLANKTEANQRDTFQERKYSLDLVACKLLLILIRSLLLIYNIAKQILASYCNELELLLLNTKHLFYQYLYL